MTSKDHAATAKHAATKKGAATATRAPAAKGAAAVAPRHYDEFEETPGGLYLDAKGNPHDAWGNALDAASLEAAGYDPSAPSAIPPHWTASEQSLIGMPAPIPLAPAEEEPPAEEPAADDEAPVSRLEAGRAGKPSQASVDAAAALAAAPPAGSGAVASVTVTLGAPSVAVGATSQASANVQDAVGATLTDKVVSWTSSDGAVATVNATGLATAVAAGSADIVGTCEGVSGQATLTVAAARRHGPSA